MASFEPRVTQEHRHEMLWDCYLSGQMEGADLEREIAADADFAAFVTKLQLRH